MLLLFFCNCWVNPALKSYHVRHTGQISYCVISASFLSWRKRSTLENLIWILKFNKKDFLLVLKSRLNDGTVAFHMRRYFEEEWFIFIVNLFSDFLLLYSQLLRNSLLTKLKTKKKKKINEFCTKAWSLGYKTF